MSNTELSIVIVNYKTPELTSNCIKSIYQNTVDLDFEVILVDNNSEDESKEIIMKENPLVNWVQMDDNAGTSRGYNAGVRNAKGKYVLILNSDTVVRDNAIKKSLDFHKQKERECKVGLTSCQIKGFDDEIQFNSNPEFPSIKKYLSKHPVFYKLGIRTPNRRTTEEKVKLHQTNHETAWIGIAFGIINMDIFTKEKLYFDEDIFMYSDEVEWCFRLQKLGYRHFFTADYTIYHVNSGSSVASDWRFGQIILSELMYFYKIKGKLLYNLMIKSLKYLHKKQPGIHQIEEDVVNRYAEKIKNEYKTSVSSGSTYLKYDLK